MKYFSFGDYRLDTLKSEIRFYDEPLELEPQVYYILELLITRHGDVVSRDDIIAKVWDGRVVDSSVIDNRIRAARAAIGDTGKAQRFIKTYPNRGYKFIGKVRGHNEDTSLSKNKNLGANSRQDNTASQGKSIKSVGPHLPKAAFPLAGLLLSGLFGFYTFSQSTKATSDNASVNVEAANDQDIYSLAVSDDVNALPRVAILPFETIGENSAYGLMPDVFEGQFNSSITAIKGITVVSFSTGLNSNKDFTDYDALKEDFGLDYVIASKLSPYGEDFKLNVSLIRLDDSSALFNEVYDLKPSSKGGLKNLPTDIASKATLMTANTLDLSMESLPKSWKNYDFYLKVEEAKAIVEPRDYESLTQAAQILREAIQEEPNYLPTYALLHSYLAWLYGYLVEGDEVLLKEQAELALKMKEISPNAPETLLINSYMDSTVDGIVKESLGEFDSSDPISVMNYILQKDPDHLGATSDYAYYLSFVKDQPETVKAYENVMRLVPTDNLALMDYSQALFCNEEIDRSHEVLRRLKEWHPNHRFALLAQLRESRALGDYKTALISFKRLLDYGIIHYDDSGSAKALFLDLGHPELVLQHIRFPPTRAHVYAMMDNKEAALDAAEDISSFRTSVRARMIVDKNYFPEDYSVSRTYSRVGEPGGVTQANACRLDELARNAYVLKKIGSEKFDRLLPLLIEFFEGRDVEKLKTQQEYTALMGLHFLQGDFDKAVEVMDIAMDRGFLFIGSFKEPYLRELTTYPGVAERIGKMQASADALLQQYYLE